MMLVTYIIGTKSRGVLRRQKGESMVSYIARRRRWWQKLKSLGSSMNVSESILADYLLLCSGLDQNQRLMTKTAIGNSEKKFANVANFLRKHHSTIHENESKEKTSVSSQSYSWIKSKSHKSSNPSRSTRPYKSRRTNSMSYRRWPEPQAFVAEAGEDAEQSETSFSEDDDSADSDAAYHVQSCAQKTSTRTSNTASSRISYAHFWQLSVT